MTDRTEVLAYILSNFRVYPIANTLSDELRRNTINTHFLDKGVILDFDMPSLSTAFGELNELFRSYHNPFKPLDYKTILTREEGQDPYKPEILGRQIMEYFETYALGYEGSFNLNLPTGTIFKVALVRGVSENEFRDIVRKRLYTNAPIKDVKTLLEIIKMFRIDLNINEVANNEVRVALFDKDYHTFASGDDVVRWIIWRLSESTLLIKSRCVIQDISTAITAPGVSQEILEVVEKHKFPLSQVFHRHKNLILTLKKNKNFTSVINQISRMAKKNHVPIHPSLASELIARFMRGEIDKSVLSDQKVLTNRQLFKILNVIEYRLANVGVEGYLIRNGKSWTKSAVDRYNDRINLSVLLSYIAEEIGRRLRESLSHKVIVLPSNVDYGLPISEKQTLGRLPFGTRIYPMSDKISCGIYWKNSWGARDLDLSTVDQRGNRTGWGYYGYNTDAKTHFSGDVTSAEEGGMEFIVTSEKDRGLFVNIFSGDGGAEYELVVGADGDLSKKWIDEPIVREKSSLTSRGNIIGFTRQDDKGMFFTVYQTALNSRVANFGEVNPFIKKALVRNWTVREILSMARVKFYTTANIDLDRKIDYDLSYDSFSFSKLAEMLDC